MPSTTLTAGVNTLVCRANPLRQYWIGANTGANQLNIAFGTAATSTGDVPVMANGNYEMFDKALWKGDIFAYSAAGTTIMFCER